MIRNNANKSLYLNNVTRKNIKPRNSIEATTMPILPYKHDRIQFIPGGFRKGARYPDIIIDKNDWLRIIPQQNIISHVKQIFRINDLIHDMTNFGIPPWGSVPYNHKTPFDKANKCIMKYIFSCNTDTQCAKARKKYPLSLTNITALPMIPGDCREIAWYTAFNYALRDNSSTFRVMYATLYTIIESSKELHELMDHVFVICINSEKTTIIDPYSDTRYDNQFILHGSSIIEIPRKHFKGYSVYSSRPIEQGPTFICGDTIVKGKYYGKILAIPKIYNGSVHFLKNDEFSNDDSVMLWNTRVPWSNHVWKLHKEWCKIR